MFLKSQYESLYHFTCGDRLNDILKYGIIFGDVLMRDDEGFNAPCFTTEVGVGNLHNLLIETQILHTSRLTQ